MTEQKQLQKQIEKKSPALEKKLHVPEKEIIEESLVRISGYDVPGTKNAYVGLTRIKGVSWGISNAVCVKLGIPRMKKISELTKDEIIKIEKFLKAPEISDFLKNRRLDVETGETKHYIGTELDIRKDFDIRKMKKIRSYKGIRHTSGQPVRGQRTRSHFRKKGKIVAGVKRKAIK
ncbi:30S ribosomal protein S13 [Candidatus Pacearchaeota archaeon]|nr:30S ribosomal protein S13 [Candidatus Pacearchaeota archaeon]